MTQSKRYDRAGSGILPLLVVLAGALLSPRLALGEPSPAAAAPPQHEHATHGAAPASADAASMPPPLFDDLGSYQKKIATRSELAQRYFDQGMRLYFGFNLGEATRAFQEAARLDPEAPMAWWGVALAAGPNYNSPIDGERNARALAATQRAVALAPAASEQERAYVEALATRYSADPARDRKALDEAFASAMRALATRYPDDLDAQALYAESLMNLRPWDLYDVDGTPRPGTAGIVATLEQVMARDPNHPGANHYYVHAVEASLQPERGLAAADRLRALSPGAGHLVHMPAHIYMRTGRYADASEANMQAIAADRAYFAKSDPSFEYRMMYYPHNIDFLWAAASMEGRSAEALRAAREMQEATPVAMVREMVDMEGGLVAPLFVLARFGKWDAILAEPAPPADLPYALGSWHYARGLALLRKGQTDAAQRELAELERITAATAPGRTIQIVNKTRAVLAVEVAVLVAEVAAARGDRAAAIAGLEKAVVLQEHLRYMEPPPFYYPIRQSLGAELLAAGRAADAEAVYRADLERNPANGWSLYGLALSLRAQGKDEAADAVEQQRAKAWSRADVELAASRF